MKRIMVSLMFLVLISGMAYSETRTVYLIVPASATSLSYYAVDKNGSEVTLTKDSTEISPYLGNSSLKLVTLKASTENTFKLMAKYELNDKYYFLISSDTDTDSDDGLATLESNFVSTYSPSGVCNQYTSYSSYPGIKILDDVRLSMIPVTGKFTEITGIDVSYDGTTYTNVVVSGLAGISPTDSTSIFKLNDVVYPDLSDLSDGSEFPVTYVQFKAKNTNSSTFTYNGIEDVASATYTITGEVNLTFTSENSGQGQWYMDVSPAGDTVVLIDDTGVTAEREIAATSKASDKSKSRDTKIKTSLIDSNNFIIKNIQE